MTSEVKQGSNTGVAEPTQKPTVSQAIPENKPQEDAQEKNWKEVRAIMEEQKRENARLRQEMENFKAQSYKPQPDQVADQRDVYSEFGLSKEDIPNVEQVARMLEKQVEERERKRAFEAVPQQFSDFQDVIKHTDDYVKENPAAQDVIMKSYNPRLTAYQLVKSWYKYRDMTKPPVTDEGKKAMDNLSKPQPNVGYASAALNTVSDYSRLSPERMAEIRRLSDEYASRR